MIVFKKYRFEELKDRNELSKTDIVWVQDYILTAKKMVGQKKPSYLKYLNTLVSFCSSC